MSYDVSGRPIPPQKYGLVRPNAAAKQEKTVGLKRPPPSIFGRDALEDEDEDDGGGDSRSSKDAFVKRANKMFDYQNQQNTTSKEVGKVHATAIDEDPSIFDYDGSYDSFKQQANERLASNRLISAGGAKAAPSSRYISDLKSAALVREKEKDRVYERRLLKERELEDKEFGDTEKFVTQAYKEKLLEQRKWEYEDRLNAELEARHDVTKVGMQSFYANLLTKNVSAGASIKENSISAYTAGGARQSSLLSDPNETTTVAEADLKLSIGIDANALSSSSLHESEQEQKQEELKDKPVAKGGLHENKEKGNLESGSNPVPEATIVSKDEKLLSAKERYLARKQQQSSTTTVSTSVL